MDQLIIVIFKKNIFFFRDIYSKSTKLFFHLFVTFIVKIFITLVNLIEKIKLIILLRIFILILIIFLLRFDIFFELLLRFDEIVFVCFEHLVVSILAILWTKLKRVLTLLLLDWLVTKQTEFILTPYAYIVIINKSYWLHTILFSTNTNRLQFIRQTLDCLWFLLTFFIIRCR